MNLPSCCGAEVVQPWQLRPRSLISWLEMLHFSAENFFWCGAALREIQKDCYLGSAGIFNNGPGFQTARDLDTAARDKSIKSLLSVETQFRGLGLAITADTVNELMNDLTETQRRHSFQWLIDKVESIESLARKELNNKLFLYVPQERAKFWPRKENPNLFGTAVANSFPSASFDIFNAGTCLATSHPTASVFHLMRILEIGLGALGKIFGVSMANTNWGPVIDQLESKIRKMHEDVVWKALPDCKEQQTFYSQAASHFGILKDAWRNHTMHARWKYDPDEAERIFESVKAFMQKLSEKIAE